MKARGGGFRLVWLQRGGTINDQTFDSYAIFAAGERHSVLTSRLHLQDSRDFSSPSDQKRLLPMQTLIIAGTFIGIVGFIAQFTGLRGMHWSASISQLVGIFLMSIVRAAVRRHMSTARYFPTTYQKF